MTMKTLIENHAKETNKDNHFITRVVVMTISAAIFAFSLASFILNVDVKTLDYHENGNVTYDVCLKQNEYFSDECQPSGKQYIASLIRTIDADFHYGFNAEEEINYGYSYDISAKLIAVESGAGDKVLYENEETLLPKKTIANAEGKTIKINEPIEINYQKYNSLMTSFRAEYGLAFKANLYVTMNIKLDGKNDDFSDPIAINQKVTLRIPMSERTINVALETDRVNNASFIQEKSRGATKNLLYLSMIGSSLFVFIIVLIISIIILAKRKASRSEYDRKLNKIMKEYNQLIVEVEHAPKIDKNNIIDVKSFEELLDARDTIQKPILHLTISDNHSMFIIGDDNGENYVYTLKAVVKRRQAKRKKDESADK